VTQSFSVQVKEKGLTLSQALQQDLPDLYLDKDRIFQVIYNLFSNAIKFTPQGGSIAISAERIEANHGAESRTPLIRIRIRDTGRGIPEEDLRRVFDKFYQGGDALDGKPKGTGLGLAISREIVQHYSGNIAVESQEGTGSTFSITLPVTADPTTA